MEQIVTDQSVKAALIYTLDKLTRSEIKRFKNFLSDLKPKDGFSTIGRGQLYKLDVDDLVQMLINYYTKEDAVKVTINVLNAANLKQYALDLEEDVTRILSNKSIITNEKARWSLPGNTGASAPAKEKNAEIKRKPAIRKSCPAELKMWFNENMPSVQPKKTNIDAMAKQDVPHRYKFFNSGENKLEGNRDMQQRAINRSDKNPVSSQEDTGTIIESKPSNVKTLMKNYQDPTDNGIILKRKNAGPSFHSVGDHVNLCCSFSLPDKNSLIGVTWIKKTNNSEIAIKENLSDCKYKVETKSTITIGRKEVTTSITFTCGEEDVGAKFECKFNNKRRYVQTFDNVAFIDTRKNPVAAVPPRNACTGSVTPRETDTSGVNTKKPKDPKPLVQSYPFPGSSQHKVDVRANSTRGIRSVTSDQSSISREADSTVNTGRKPRLGVNVPVTTVSKENAAPNISGTLVEETQQVPVTTVSKENAAPNMSGTLVEETQQEPARALSMENISTSSDRRTFRRRIPQGCPESVPVITVSKENAAPNISGTLVEETQQGESKVKSENERTKPARALSMENISTSSDRRTFRRRIPQGCPESGRTNVFQGTLLHIKKPTKLTCKDVQDIGSDVLKTITLQNVPDTPYHFLKKIMQLDRTARSHILGTQIHYLDFLCDLLLSSDNFLLQEIMSKMTMCHFAIPLLLPFANGQNCTFMLWSMREIIKRWSSETHLSINNRAFTEERLVNIEMPVFTFVRLGTCSFSKSQIINQVLSPDQQSYDYFVHRSMDEGNTPRKISHGLAEIFWYFPGEADHLAIFQKPFAIINLHGDLESNPIQFTFLTQISSVMLIFSERRPIQNFNIPVHSKESDVQYFCFVRQDTNNDLRELQKQCGPSFTFENHKNDTDAIKKLKSVIREKINRSKHLSFRDLDSKLSVPGVLVDEQYENCQRAKQNAQEITQQIKDVAEYKRTNLSTHWVLGKQLAKIEKKYCRLSQQWDMDRVAYESKLNADCKELRKQQKVKVLSHGMSKFIEAITSSQSQRRYFVKWMKYYLELLTVKEMKNKRFSSSSLLKIFKEPEHTEPDRSLGVEHFMRELAQLYEAKNVTVQKKQEKRFFKLPAVVADLWLGGFPLELIDGNASYVPLQWISDVLTELNNKTGGHCRMRVITVLGVQSTGKSTLLNTMFGLQFPVSSGRCTRGAFMTLINVKENFKQELGCDFILVIDTEGLKAPELASLEGSYEHDNELATLVIGLSDITIIDMENTDKLKSILQIVIHAFIALEKIEKKPTCQFVHHNLGDVSAHEKQRHRDEFLNQLNEMTRAAAKTAQKNGFNNFSDVMNYNPEENNWYFDTLTAPTLNSTYSEITFNFKKYLFECIKLNSTEVMDTSMLKKSLRSLWNLIVKEKFLLGPRNDLVASAYDLLIQNMSAWEWEFRNNIYDFMRISENKIKNTPADAWDAEDGRNNFTHKLDHQTKTGETDIAKKIENHFESGSDCSYLMQKNKNDIIDVNYLINQLTKSANQKYNEIEKVQRKIKHVQICITKILQLIEEKLIYILQSDRAGRSTDDVTLEIEFEQVWGTFVPAEGQQSFLNKCNIEQEMLKKVRDGMENKTGIVSQKVKQLKSLLNKQTKFTMKTKYIDITWYTQCENEVYYLAESLIYKCDTYVTEKASSQTDFEESYCEELMDIIQKRLEEIDVKKLPITALFEFYLKRHILQRAAATFQKMHDTFVQQHDPHRLLASLKPHYFSIFKYSSQNNMDSQNRAETFCNLCLEPAITDHVYQRLGIEIVNDILSSDDSKQFSSQTRFQFTVMKHLLEESNAEKYISYLKTYETFVKRWILTYISNRYNASAQLDALLSAILSAVIKKLRNILREDNFQNVSHFLETFCKRLSDELVISPQGLKHTIFRNTTNVSQFAREIDTFLPQIENRIKGEIQSTHIEAVLSKLTIKPQNELFRKVFGCGQRCPFCNVPCEAGGADHKEHFASLHRPKGLNRRINLSRHPWHHSTCSTDIVSKRTFQNADATWKNHPYKYYRQIYPDWLILPDKSINTSLYWQFVYNEINEQIAQSYNRKAAKLPEAWKYITQQQARDSLMETFKNVL